MLPLSAIAALYRQYIAYMLTKQELKARACYVGKKALIGGTWRHNSISSLSDARKDSMNSAVWNV
jgi:hypothetical protein